MTFVLNTNLNTRGQYPWNIRLPYPNKTKRNEFVITLLGFSGVINGLQGV